MLNDNSLIWSPNPWARNSPNLDLPKTPTLESKQAWRQRMSRYVPDQAWRFVIDNTMHRPRRTWFATAHHNSSSTTMRVLYGLSARQILKRFIRERSCAQEFAERYLNVREKVAVYPGEEIDDDPLLSRVVMEQELQLEIDDAIAHLDSLLAILSYIQKRLPSHWRYIKDRPPLPVPNWPDLCNLWTVSCLFSSFCLYTEILAPMSIVFTILLAIGLFYLGMFLLPYISRWYRSYRIESLRTDILRLWYAFRTDPESINSGAIRVLDESRSWVVEWYLLGDRGLSQIWDLPSLRQPGSTMFRWRFRVPSSWLDIEVCVNRGKEEEQQDGEGELDYWQMIRQILVNGNNRLWARWAGVPHIN